MVNILVYYTRTTNCIQKKKKPTKLVIKKYKKLYSKDVLR